MAENSREIQEKPQEIWEKWEKVRLGKEKATDIYL
jgi:hypothetical protein